MDDHVLHELREADGHVDEYSGSIECSVLPADEDEDDEQETVSVKHENTFEVVSVYHSLLVSIACSSV
jgi:hypothetical protein